MDVGFVDHFLDPPWPAPQVEPGEKPGVWPTTDRPAYLRWLVTSEAEPWVPTVAELKAKVDEVAQWLRGGRPEPDEPGEESRATLDDAAQRREQRRRRQDRWDGEDLARANRGGLG